MKPGGIAKQKTVDSSAGAASVLMDSRREPLCLTLNVSTRKKLHSLHMCSQCSILVRTSLDRQNDSWPDILIISMASSKAACNASYSLLNGPTNGRPRQMYPCQNEDQLFMFPIDFHINLH